MIKAFREHLYKKLIVVYNFKRLYSITFKTNTGSHKIVCESRYLEKEYDNNRSYVSSLREYTLDTEQLIIAKMKEEKVDITTLTVEYNELDYPIIVTYYFDIEDVYISKIVKNN